MVKEKSDTARSRRAITAKPPKLKARQNIFIREEDIPRLLVMTRAGEMVQIELLCGDHKQTQKESEK